MINSLASPIAQAIYALIAAIAGLIAVYPIFFHRKRRSISYEIIVNTEILTVGEELRGDLQVTYKEKQIREAHIVVLKIINTGNVDFVPTDFYEPITFRFNNGAVVLTADVISKSPKNLKVQIKPSKNKLRIDPLLLNQKEYFNVKLFVSDFDGTIEPEFRIGGVREIKSLNYWKQQLKAIFAIISLLAIFSFLSIPIITGNTLFIIIFSIGLAVLMTRYVWGISKK